MWLILLVVVLTLFIFWIQRCYSFWSRKGVPGPKPLPLVGNFGKSFTGKMSAGEIVTNTYKEYESYPFVGIYRTTTPVLLIRDPDFIKNILVQDFKHFHDNDIEVDVEINPILGRNPFCMKGIEWRNKRAQLTSMFTSGKIKAMFPFMEKSGKRMCQYIEDETKSLNPLEAREICVRFALDNVAACAFGLEGKSFDEPCSEFKKLADAFLSPEGMWNKLIWLIWALFPTIPKLFKLKLISKEVEDRLMHLVTGSLKYRKDNNVVRNDFLDAVRNLKTEDGLFTEVDIVAHAASFFGDGYETSSRVMSFLLFDLAETPDVQEKLRNEINDAVRKNNNQLTYEIIQDLQYLDACLSESLRKYFISHYLSKICTEDYTYTPTNPEFKKISVTLKAGDSIVLPIVGLQMDPKYFEDPDRFMPERFQLHNNINRFTYFPFGEGQRACLGQRFAQIQIKTGVAYIIKNFRLTVNSKTKLPLKFDPYYIMRDAIGGLWIDLEKLN